MNVTNRDQAEYFTDGRQRSYVGQCPVACSRDTLTNRVLLGRFFFNAVREGDHIVYASDDENECHLWVMAMYRATGQSHKPTPPISVADKNSTISKIQGDTDRAKKHGMEDYISADPCKFDHAALFKFLQNLILDYRLNDPYCSLGWFSPGQVFVLDEYCAR